MFGLNVLFRDHYKERLLKYSVPLWPFQLSCFWAGTFLEHVGFSYHACLRTFSWICNAVCRHASIWREKIYHVYGACTGICGHLHLERKYIPTSTGVLPFVDSDWSLKLAVCREVDQTLFPLLLNSHISFYTGFYTWSPNRCNSRTHQSLYALN